MLWHAGFYGGFFGPSGSPYSTGGWLLQRPAFFCQRRLRGLLHDAGGDERAGSRRDRHRGTRIATKMQANDANGVKAATIPRSPAISTASLLPFRKLILLLPARRSVTSVYDLEATDAPPGEDAVQFFCGVAANDLHVIFNIPGLPAGHFAFAIVEATGVKNPQRLSMLLEKSASRSLATGGIFSAPAHERRTRWCLVLGEGS